MNKKNNFLSNLFSLSLIIPLIILLLPNDYKISVYTPSILGYIWILLFPIILITFLLLSYQDYIKKIKKKLLLDQFH